LEISRRYEVVKCSFGIYPIDALVKEVEEGVKRGNAFLRNIEEFDVDGELNWIEAHSDDCVAIGEIGLDYNWKEFQTEDLREKQKRVFRKCLKLAKKIDKPVVIHSRKAEEDAIEILEKKEFGGLSVIMHCFNGKKSLIKRCVENGWYFSVPPVIMRLEHFKMLVRLVPLGQLLTETDAPYLSPVVGKKNESMNVGVTIREIARIKGLDVKVVSEQIFKNALELFNL